MNNTDLAKQKLFEDTNKMCSQLPNDAELGKSVRAAMSAHKSRTFLFYYTEK